MPIQIPRYQRRTQGHGGAVPGVRVTAQTQAAQAQGRVGQAAQQFSQVGQELVTFGEKVREEQEQAARMEAFNKLNKRMEAALSDPKTGFLNTKENEAIQRRGAAIESFDKIAEEIRNGQATDRMKANFDQMVGERKTQFTQSVDRHTSQESERYRAKQFKSTLDGLQNHAFIASQRGEDIEPDLEHGLVLIEEEGKKNGLGDKVISEQRLAFTTGVHIPNLEESIRTNESAKGLKYLGRYVNDIDARILSESKIEQRLLARADENDSIAMAKDIYGAVGGSMEEFSYYLDGMLAGDSTAGVKITEKKYEAVLKWGEDMRKQEDVQIKAHDDPFADSLRAQLYDSHAGDFDSNDDRFIKIKDDGTQAKLLHERALWRRQARMERQDRINLQALLLRAGMADFDAQPSFPADGDVNQLNIDVDERYPNLNKMGRDTLKAYQKKLRTQYERDKGVGLTDYMTTIAPLVNGLKGTVEKKRGIAAQMKKLHVDWREAQSDLGKDPGAQPPRSLIWEWMNMAVMEGYERDDDWYAIEDSMTYIEALEKNLPFKDEEGGLYPSRTVREVIIDKLVAAKRDPTEELIQKVYDKNPQGFEEEFGDK